MGLGNHEAPSIPHDTPTLTATPTPPTCSSQTLQVVEIGVFKECANAAPDSTSICSLNDQVLEARLRFASNNDVFVLDIEIDGTFTGPGVYELLPWSHGLGTRGDVPKVVLNDHGNHAVWQSIAGLLTVMRSDGRSGTVDATLQPPNALPQPSSGPPVQDPTIGVLGTWSCP